MSSTLEDEGADTARILIISHSARSLARRMHRGMAARGSHPHARAMRLAPEQTSPRRGV